MHLESPEISPLPDSKPLILVIDDQPDIQRLFSDLIADEGLGRVIHARNRADVRRILDELNQQGLKLGAACLDLHLMGESGFPILHEPELQEVPVLITSALDDETNRRASEGYANVVAFRGRPFDVTEIVNDLKGILTPPPTKNDG